MTANKVSVKVRLQEEINFLLTNRIPRRLANRLIGWLSHIESPLLARVAIGIWRQFADLDFSESTATQFTSLHACFTRQLKPGARPINPDPAVITSPCDAIVGACGAIDHDRLIQAKGFGYRLEELLRDPQLVELYRDGQYATLRLTSSMYHRFHAPYDCHVERVAHFSGDTWNVNPIALKRVDRLFCKNERAIIPLILPDSHTVITLVPVGAILVASIRLHFLNIVFSNRYGGASEFACSIALRKGQEMGWFEHGSTIIVFAPRGVELCALVRQGTVIRMGSALMRLS